ncbi:MAG TPA: hypothetical protein VIA29_00680 [Thermoanaerobaculia bacterium]
MERRKQVGQTDVEEARRRQGDRDGYHRSQPRQKESAERGAEEGAGRGGEVGREGLAAGIARRHQDCEVSELLRDLVGEDGQRRGDAERDVDQKRGRDYGAIRKVVEGIPEEDQRTARAVLCTIALVAVPPEQEALEEEEEEDAPDDDAQGRAAALPLDRLRQKLQQGRGQHRSCRIGKQAWQKPVSRRSRKEEKQSREEDGEGAAQRRDSEDPAEDRHGRLRHGGPRHPVALQRIDAAAE